MSRTKHIRSLIYSRQEAVFVDAPGFVDDVANGESGSIGCRILSEEKVTESRLDAYAYLVDLAKEKKVSLAGMLDADPELYERERTLHLIQQAFVEWPVEDEDDPKLAFTEVQSLRTLDSIYVQALLEAYLGVQDTKGVQREFRAEDIDDLLARLRAPGGEGALALLTPTGLRSVILAIARREPASPDAPTAPTTEA